MRTRSAMFFLPEVFPDQFNPLIIIFKESIHTLPAMNERFTTRLKLIASHLVPVMILLVASGTIPGYQFLFLSLTQTALLILYFSGYWEFFGLRFRRVFCGGIELILVVLVIHGFLKGFSVPPNPYLALILLIAEIYLLILLIRILIVICKKDSRAQEIEFPFRNGRYLVTDGGNSRTSRLMNYHYYSRVHRKKKTNLSMLYATDIVKVKDDKPVWFPVKNEDYAIFSENIYSPLDGSVVKVVDGIPDNEPWSGNYPYNTGNTVVVKKEDGYLLLGHLKKGSIAVKEGDRVQAGDLIASAGNSGWTERPHLHMQLIRSDSPDYWFGTGVCIRYKNRNLYKNRIL
jgi:hypothetical protein